MFVEIQDGMLEVRVTMKAYRQLLLENIEPYEEDEADMVGTTDRAQLRYAYDVMVKESGLHELQEFSEEDEQNYCKQWLMGLPTVCPVPFEDFQIMYWFEQLVGINSDHDQGARTVFLSQYWDRMADALINGATE